jgi:catechol-2,3-dioxygenase
MPITRLNHAVLYVRDVEVTRDFYEGALDFETLIHLPGQAAFLRAPGSTNDHDLGVFQIGSGAGPSAAGRSTVGLYHLAWEVDTLDELDRLRTVLAERGALVGQSDHVTTKSLYGKDPDGLELEVCWILPAHVLTPELTEEARANTRPRPLDLEAEKARYGAQTKGGVGISIPEPAG